MAVAFIAWSPVAGRSSEIATALRGEAACFYRHPRFGKLSVVLRYVRSTVSTALYLRRRRPRAVIATNPPILPGLLAFAYARLRGAAVALDSHPGGFGLQGDRVSRVLQPLHVWLARRVTTNLVPDQTLAERVAAWGARADIVHEAPGHWGGAPRGEIARRPRILFVGTFQRDEPVDAVLDAARRLPDVDVQVTGDLRRCPADLPESAPPNVSFVGFLQGDDYRRVVREADVVLALTTEPSSVVRAGYEAVYAHRPLVVSDWPAGRRVFPYAVHVTNHADGVAAGLRRAVAEHADLLSAAPRALELQRARWDGQLSALRERMTDGVTPAGVTPSPTETNVR